jgi:hypothetical protein
MTDLDARITALHLEPGDILALRCNRNITVEHADELQRQLKNIIGESHPILILPPMIELMVVRYPLDETA